MIENMKKHMLAFCLVAFAIPLGTGCNTNLADLLDELDLDDIEITINNAINRPQDVDPRVAPLPSDFGPRGNTIIIADEVVFVDDVSTDLAGVSLPDITLLGFENITGWDIYLEYTVDGVLQSALVLDGETLLLDYPCIFDLELLLEEDYDPFTGDFIQAFDLTGSIFLEGDDYFCGDAFIITIDPVAIEAGAEAIDLF
ncbi:MAG: hypothetical protein H6818_17795 [Phycisphaerales bacterium]|nr:hypothetical protein [Phycisphaerales bacterium]MCB9864477.1 hypothetical protein [Phycisphaerales bacterium]